MRNITNISNSRQASQGDEYRFMGQSYVAHMINVAIAICPSLNQAVEPDVGI